MNNPRRATLTLLLCSLLSQAEADCDYDDFPRMDGMLISSVGSHVQWNHTPLNARTFRVPASVQGVRDFYTQQWPEAVDFSEFDQWQQILHINEQCLVLLQVKAQNERYSFGRISITQPPQAQSQDFVLGSGMPVPPEALVVSDMRSDDKIRQGRLLVLLSEDNLAATRTWYETELLNQGWLLEQRSLQEHASVLSFSKGRELLSVGLLRHAEKTQILLNRMDR